MDGQMRNPDGTFAAGKRYPSPGRRKNPVALAYQQAALESVPVVRFIAMLEKLCDRVERTGDPRAFSSICRALGIYTEQKYSTADNHLTVEIVYSKPGELENKPSIILSSPPTPSLAARNQGFSPSRISADERSDPEIVDSEVVEASDTESE